MWDFRRSLLAEIMPRPEPAACYDKHVFFANAEIGIKALLPYVECDVRGRGQGCLRGQS